LPFVSTPCSWFVTKAAAAFPKRFQRAPTTEQIRPSLAQAYDEHKTPLHCPRSPLPGASFRVDKAQAGTLQCSTAFAEDQSFPKAAPPAKRKTGLADHHDADTMHDHAAALLRRTVALVAEHNLAELTIEEDGLTISVRGMVPDTAANAAVMLHPHLLPPGQSPPYSQAPVLTPTAPTPAPAVVAPLAAPTGRVRIAQESPMVGVYYRSPSPEDPPFVSVGDQITVGQPIGLIEAMKVYSELPSEVAGRVVEIAAQNGKLVQQGQPILFVEPA